MGNSEVGHLNLGAGRWCVQDLTRIDDAVEDGSFFENEVLRAACAAGREAGRLHLLGLVSAGGVHASMDHLSACIELARRERVPDVVLHAFTDGRDTLPDSGAGYLAETEAWLREAGGRVGSVIGSLLRDGPRQPLGADKPGRRRDRATARPMAAMPGAGRGRCAPPTRAGRPTSSCCRARGGGGPHPRRRLGAVLQLPARPRAPADRAPWTRPTSEFDCAPHAPSPSTRRSGTTRGLSRRAARGRPWPGAGGSRASRSCTWPRRRSTPTSPTSSTAGRRTPTRARSAASSTPRATCRPTTTSPRCARAPGGRLRGALARR